VAAAINKKDYKRITKCVTKHFRSCKIGYISLMAHCAE
jgi:hypothetical protein